MRIVRHRVIYDDQCALCVRQVRRLARLDWLGRFDFVPRRAPAVTALGLDPAALAAAIHGVDRRGRVFRGAACLRWMGLRLPLLAPLALLLWLPGALVLAEKVYARVSRNRYRWGKIAPPADHPTNARFPACAQECSPPESERLPPHGARVGPGPVEDCSRDQVV